MGTSDRIIGWWTQQRSSGALKRLVAVLGVVVLAVGASLLAGSTVMAAQNTAVQEVADMPAPSEGPVNQCLIKANQPLRPPEPAVLPDANLDRPANLKLEDDSVRIVSLNGQRVTAKTYTVNVVGTPLPPDQIGMRISPQLAHFGEQSASFKKNVQTIAWVASPTTIEIWVCVDRSFAAFSSGEYTGSVVIDDYTRFTKLSLPMEFHRRDSWVGPVLALAVAAIVAAIVKWTLSNLLVSEEQKQRRHRKSHIVDWATYRTLELGILLCVGLFFGGVVFYNNFMRNTSWSGSGPAYIAIAVAGVTAAAAFQTEISQAVYKTIPAEAKTKFPKGHSVLVSDALTQPPAIGLKPAMILEPDVDENGPKPGCYHIRVWLYPSQDHYVDGRYLSDAI